MGENRGMWGCGVKEETSGVFGHCVFMLKKHMKLEAMAIGFTNSCCASSRQLGPLQLSLTPIIF